MVNATARRWWCGLLFSVLRPTVSLQGPAVAAAWSGRPSSSAKNGIVVTSIPNTPSEAAESVTALADLRYNEWIRDVYPHVSRDSFRAATMDLYHERVVLGGATILLARTPVTHESTDARVHEASSLTVGAAEFSALELNGAVMDTRSEAQRDPFGRFLYVTDLVTCRTHRRQGIALALMKAMEELALQRRDSPQRAKKGRATVTTLLLHVEPTNDAALQFYQSKLDYSTVDTRQDSTRVTLQSVVNVDRLAENAGMTNHQLLLYKTLGAAASSSTQGGRGFGRR